MIELIKQKGYDVHALPRPEGSFHASDSPRSLYEKWLGVSQGQDAKEVKEVLNNDPADWIIVDHYGIDHTWESALRLSTKKLMVIDDLADRCHDCDLILDQNYFIKGEYRYDSLVPPTCTKLLGPQFALLRNEFSKARKQLRQRDGVINRILVFFGGSDPDNLTGQALEELSQNEFKNIEVNIVIGSGNPNYDILEKQVKKRALTRLYVQINNMAELMVKADLAIGAGGATTWERLSLNLPSIIVPVADNQKPLSRDLNEKGYIWLAKSVKAIPQILKRLIAYSTNQRHTNTGKLNEALVDGNGVQRILGFLSGKIDTQYWEPVLATEKSCDLYWMWANDPQVRKSAFNSDPIPFESHKQWFQKKINCLDSTLVTIESPWGAIGQVRFEREPYCFKIHYSIGRQYRGLRLGKVLLAKAIKYFQISQKEECILVGDVKTDNPASSRVFQQLGFNEVSQSDGNVRRFQLRVTPEQLGK